MNDDMIKKRRLHRRGVFCIISAAFFFSLMSLFVKLSGDIPSVEKSFFRNLVAIVFAFAIIKKEGIPMRSGGSKNTLILTGRAVGGTIGIFCNFYAVDHLVIADANMMNKLSPFFAILFSFFLLKEKVKPYQLLAVIAAFTGAMFILKPGQGIVSFPALIGMIGGMGAGFAYANVRLASERGVPGPFIVFFFSVFSCLAAVPVMLPVIKAVTIRQLILLLGAGLAATGGQFSVTAAYSAAPAREISVYDYTQILFSALMGYLFLGEIPDGSSLIGYAIIIAAGVYMFFAQRKAEK